MDLNEIALKFKSPVWLATVLDHGDVLQAGIDAGYSYVVGATTSKEDSDYCRERFKGVPSTRIFTAKRSS
jgi:hypothetical protein